jgi:hypothetical protein
MEDHKSAESLVAEVLETDKAKYKFLENPSHLFITPEGLLGFKCACDPSKVICDDHAKHFLRRMDDALDPLMRLF